MIAQANLHGGQGLGGCLTGSNNKYAKLHAAHHLHTMLHCNYACNIGQIISSLHLLRTYLGAQYVVLSVGMSVIHPTNSHACRHDYGVRNYVAAAQHLATAQQQGLCRHVGVTNFDVPRLKEMLDAGVRIVSNQARVVVWLNLQRFLHYRSSVCVIHMCSLAIIKGKCALHASSLGTCCMASLRFYDAVMPVHSMRVHVGAGAVLAAGPAARERHGRLLRAARHRAAAVRHHRGRPALQPLPGPPGQQARLRLCPVSGYRDFDVDSSFCL